MTNTNHPEFQNQEQLLPCIVQNHRNGKVLMLGYMNQQSFEKTCTEKLVTFYSRSKQRLWTKGESSGNFLDVQTISIDCDRDTILITAVPRGPVCHTGAATCFGAGYSASFLNELEEIIQSRQSNPQTGSYTSSLFSSGINKVAQKVGEEAVELVIEAKDNNKDLFLNEAADLMFHYLVLLAAKGHSLGEVEAVLRERHEGK